MMSPNEVVNKMFEQDRFSQWLCIQVIEIREGYSKIQMTIRAEMENGFGIIHGGVTFSMADSAFAYACNNRNQKSVALDTSINFVKAVYVGDILTAEATELHNGRSTGLYQIAITNQKNELVAQFKGLCYRSGKELF
jgi:acyl-CoA thioesterase